MAMMRATIFHGVNDIRIEEVERPMAGLGEAMIRVTLTTICPSHRNAAHWSSKATSSSLSKGVTGDTRSARWGHRSAPTSPMWAPTTPPHISRAGCAIPPHKKHTAHMPKIDLTEEEIQASAAYLSSLQ